MITFALAISMGVLGWILLFIQKTPLIVEVKFLLFQNWLKNNLAALKVYIVGSLITLLVFYFTKVIVLALLSLVLTVALPGIILKNYKNKILDEKSNAWPFLIDDLISAIRSGMTLPDSLTEVAKNVPAALEDELQVFIQYYNRTGQINQALLGMKEKVIDPIGGLVIRMLLTVVRSGANDLGKSLKILSQAVRDQQQLDRELLARQSWVINSARLAVISPWIVLLAIWGQPSVQSTYQTPQGQAILFLVALICLSAYWFMKRMAVKENE
jgi:tight adherence protein B